MKTEFKNFSPNSGNEGGGNRGGNQGENSGNKRSQGDTSKRGFASMDEDEQREISKKGGEASGKDR